MSVPRSAIAEALDIPEDRVRCENCVCAEYWIWDSYICKARNEQITFADRYCSFFADKEEYGSND